MELTTDQSYLALLQQISDTYTQGRIQAVQAVNTHITQTYWQVGRQIVEFEQGGKGFSRSNLVYMRLLYQRYPISQKPSHLLSWSPYVELLKMDDPLERSFYEQQAISEKWSVSELKRQKATSLFLRLAASKDNAGVLQLSHLPNEQPTFCAEIPALPARARRTTPGTGADPARSRCCRRGVAMTLVATPARSTGARGRFGLKNASQQPFPSALAATRTEGAA